MVKSKYWSFLNLERTFPILKMHITPHSKYYIEIYFLKGGKNSNKVIGNSIMADNLKKVLLHGFLFSASYISGITDKVSSWKNKSSSS